ncbi:MAG: hypothetical protein AABZ36_03065 [Nitrospirota bacterium]
MFVKKYPDRPDYWPAPLQGEQAGAGQEGLVFNNSISREKLKTCLLYESSLRPAGRVEPAKSRDYNV